jgi:ADP-heptose:LPS heptosyltransferase
MPENGTTQHRNHAMVTLLRWMIKKAMRLMARSMKRRAAPAALRRAPRIAFLLAGGIGDGVMALPALNFLKKNFPRTAIDVFVPQRKAAVLAALLRPFSVFALTPRNVAGRWLRSMGYDYAFTNTIGTFRLTYEMVSRLTARCCASFRYPDEQPRDRMYDYTLTVSDTNHDIDQNLALVSGALGILYEEQDRAYPDIRQRAPAVKQPLISVLVHPGAETGYAYKKWPFDRFVTIIERLVKDGHRVTVLLGPSELHYYPFFSKIPQAIICHPRDPATLVTVMERTHLFIGNDSGPAHCATLFGVPTITLMGPTSPVRNAPRGRHCVTVTGTAPCAPCHFNRSTCRDNQCMKAISVDAVWEAAEKQVIRIRREMRNPLG